MILIILPLCILIVKLLTLLGMQFYGLDGKELILSLNATRGKDYLCPECLSLVRVRGGTLRQRHFYHLRKRDHCRQSKKSALHLFLQQEISRTLPLSVMERPFKEIGRIADVVYGKIVFEIQCSSIAVSEVKKRTEDYGRLGLQVVWILSDKRYNQKRRLPEEGIMRTLPSYFASEKGIFYDQFDLYSQEKRLFKGPPLKIDLASSFAMESPEEDAPDCIKRRQSWPFFFYGDLFYSHTRHDTRSIKLLEERFSRKPIPLWPRVKRFYINFIERLIMLLE